jgi:DNA-directed RNA polymerase specialized sigma24 family protein
MIAMDRTGADQANEIEAGRTAIEQALRLADRLAPADRDLMRAVYERGMSAEAFARAAGRSPRSVRGRLRRLIERMTSQPFRFVALHQRRWPAQRRRVAELVILQGLGLRAAAARAGMSIHHVRREIDRVRALIEEAATTAATQLSSTGRLDRDDRPC